jgi:cation diffusion facilitator CzcD-associated flavoprotein CzcO
MPPLEHHRVAVIGAGFAGIGIAATLTRAGYDDVVVLERASTVGGTWRDNTYPGCQCDVPSHLYSFSFAPNPEWSRLFPLQSEIWQYLEDCADRFDVRRLMRFGVEVLDARWDDAARLWRIATSEGDLTADVLVSGVGALSAPSVPDLPGLGAFEGTVFHSARWRHDHDLTGERVAVVGTGASAIQFVPAIQPKVGRLFVFQRTPPWVVRRPDRPIDEKERERFRRHPARQRASRLAIYWGRELLVVAFAKFPPAMRVLERFARAHMRRQVPDPDLRRRLTPGYSLGCKRILPSNEWYPALQKPNVELVTDPIAEIRPRSIVTASGAEREVDTIELGTGFRVTTHPAFETIRGREGLSLAEVWRRDGMAAYKGTTVAGFPNLFVMTGPNTGLGHSSVVFMLESQFAYLLDALRTIDAHGVASVEPTPEAQAAYNAKVQAKLAGTVWNTGGCSSWYLDSRGRNTTLWPGFTWQFRLATRRFDPEAYRMISRAAATAAAEVVRV